MSKRPRLQGAIDTEIHVSVRKFIESGVSPDVSSLYTAIQKSNSSLKRKPKKVIQQSLERVLDFMNVDASDSEDSEAAIEEATREREREERRAETMNRALRANLASQAANPASGSATPVNSVGKDDGSSNKSAKPADGERPAKRQRVEGRSKPNTDPPTDVSLKDIGGVDDVIDQLGELLVLPLLQPEVYAEAGIGLPRGILLHGPPGCGKTMISRAFAASLAVPFVEILGPSIVSGMSGESEKGVRERFEEAKRNAPCLIFIDEIDAIAPKRESSQSQMEKRIVAQLLVSMDELERDPLKPVIVLAATNRPDSLDPALRRGGRFDTEINIGVPNEKVRASILKAQTRKGLIANDVDFVALAKRTAGYVGADLHDLVKKAGSWQMSKFREAMMAEAHITEPDITNGEMEIDSEPTAAGIDFITNPAAWRVERLITRARNRDLPRPAGFEDFKVTMEAFNAVITNITPSSKREGFTTVPDVSWADIGALQSIREELQTAIVDQIQHPELYEAIGISKPGGVLLWGPPGCGKTLLAKAVAAESKANFISVKGPELLNKYVGESERAVRQVFQRARSSQPCVIFFDELDALVPRRDDAMSEASSRVVNTMLTELDGMSARSGIYLIAATNRPDIIDEAMLRPGRLETPLFVDLPGPNERAEILQSLMRSRPISQPAAALELVGQQGGKCEGYSGADLDSLLRKAGQFAIRARRTVIEMEDFEKASGEIQGSVKDVQKYYRLREKFGRKS
ncbi:AAA-domain-containing protein [Polychaeton citri CBS 116435]|uniref:AAA-domain-containing protein n=1 Tax=Polychaeton citri CBS 116435 TaxID=1314669 RepID=A0A9P4QA24_9PEZI|nr:AAA-domain-containing protein [Polychaeton citri CBS 116435]